MENGATESNTGSALRECDRHVREMLDNVHLIAVMLDLSGNIIYCNNFLCELTGWSKEELLGRNWFDTCLPETVRDTVKAYFLNSIKTGHTTPHYENEIVTKSGEKRIILWSNSILRGDSGECMGTTSIGEDITLRVQTEEALREANLILKGIFDASPLPIFVIDPDGIVRMWNKASVHTFGWTVEEALGRPLPIVPPEKREQHLSILERIGSGEIMANVELERRRKDGSPIMVSLSTAPIKEIDGKLKGIISITVDITGKKKADEERAAMFHMLTHDIKGPLSVIYGYGEISSNKMSPDDSARIMADIQKAGRRIYAIIDDILSLSRLESDEPHLLIRPVSLPKLVEQALKENEAGAAERDITITVGNTGAPPMIYADPDQLGRAVGNLVANAINYSKKGGNIRVSTGIASGQANWIFIEVADNGDGIPDEDIPHIFEKYYRGKRSAKKRGTGLGLAIVKAAADAHGGKVELKSKAGEGSTFTITLPVKPGM